MALPIILSVVVIILGYFLTQILKQKLSKFPPGPRILPIVGNIHQLTSGQGPLEVIQQWNKTYGDVVGCQFGNYKTVILNGYETIKEAYNMPEFGGRALLKPFHAITHGEKRGLLLSEGEAWVEQRRFALRNLRDFGFGKKSMESLIQEDIEELIDSLKNEGLKPFVPHRRFSTAVVKSLWNIIAGEKYAYGDPRFQGVLDAIHIVTSSTPITGPIFFMPWLTSLFPGKTGWINFKTSIEKARALVHGYIKEHQSTFQKDTMRDFMDVYLKEIYNTDDTASSFYKQTGEDHMLVGILNLLAAGSETTSNTIVWALLFLIKHPQIQQKLYDEISSVVGTSRLPSLDDKASCPYTHAFMEEVFRKSSLIPLGVFHNTMEDITFKGYVIPKDTLVFANQYGIHHDEKIWTDPETFRPERFLNDDGTVKKNPGISIPFSVGKRICLGETLARNNFFLYLTSLVQKFQITGASETDAQAVSSPGLIRSPTTFSIVLKERE